jgi:hypothetical protein
MSGGALIQLMASETFQEKSNELLGLELGIFIFASAVALWLAFTRS